MAERAVDREHPVVSLHDVLDDRESEPRPPERPRARLLHPEEALSREQAIRFYTGNDAYLLFLEDQIGSLEPGKLADLIVLDTDLLQCPEDQIKAAQVLKTYFNGKLVFSRS